MDKELSARIRYARERAGLSQKELASMLQMSPSNWHKIETGKLNLSFDLARNVADALCVDVGYLAGSVPYERAVTDPTYHEGQSTIEMMVELDEVLALVKDSAELQRLVTRIGDWPSPLLRLFAATVDTFEAGIEAASLFAEKEE